MKLRLLTCAGLVVLGRPALAQSTLTFATRAPLPWAHYGMGYCNDQGTIYQVGGGSAFGAFSSDTFHYSPATDTWTLDPGNYTPQRWTTAALLDPSPSTGLVYVLNGQQNFANDPATLVESVTVANGTNGPSSTNPQPTASAGSAVWNGLLYCFGGSNGPTYSSALRSYNRATGAWATLAPMPEAKEARGAAVNGKIYVFGGYNGVINSSRIDAYDIATNQWQALGTLPTTLSNQAVAVQGEVIWLVGDFTSQSYLAAYNTRTGQLRTFTSNLPPRRNAGAAVLGNQLYVWGGNTASANSSALADMWRADVSSVLARASPATATPLRAWPNPLAAGQMLCVALPGLVGTQLTLLDAQGRPVLRTSYPAGTTQATFDLTTQAAGFYLLQAETVGQPPVTCRVVCH